MASVEGTSCARMKLTGRVQTEIQAPRGEVELGRALLALLSRLIGGFGFGKQTLP